MKFLRFVFAALLAGGHPFAALAQSDDQTTGSLSVELNTTQDTGTACRLTFVINNMTGTAIDEAVFETVIFNGDGSVVSLSLFDFRDLPADRPRVRQFDLPGMTCAAVGQALINGSSSCVVEGAESDLCHNALVLSSRVNVELLG
ncbi:MAG: hypothetical protein AAF496_11800 [Pseudomonadota bacterium]